MPFEAALFRSPDDRCDLTSWRPPRRRARYCKVPLTYYGACIFLLLASHVLSTGSSSETWSNGWLSLPNYQRQLGMDALIAVLWDFCPAFSSWGWPAVGRSCFFFFYF